MKPKCLKPFPLRTVLVGFLLALWLAGSVQAAVHGLVMTGQAVQPAMSATHSYASVSNELPTHSQSGQSAHHVRQNTFGQIDAAPTSGAHIDAPCLELCLLMSLAPTTLSLSHGGPRAALFVEPLGIPAGLTQPAVPPPRPLLL